MINIPDKEHLISASVSCFNLYNIETQLPSLESAGIGLLHFDVVDGKFNDCFILGTPTLAAIRPHTNLPIEVHLAVASPEKYIKQFADAGADYIAVHYEAMTQPNLVFQMIRDAGALPILALRAETDYSPDMDSLFKQVEWVTKLTVNPGYSGQKIQEQTIDMIKRIRFAINRSGLKTRIQADGNINPQTIPSVVCAGADILVGGSSGLFVKEMSIQQAVLAMHQAASYCCVS